MKIYLRDLNEEIVHWWEHYFKGIPDVEVSCGDIFDINADAIISPANSFGFMDGGIDAAYTKFFGLSPRFNQTIEDCLRQAMKFRQVPVGNATTIFVGFYEKGFSYLISAPTMGIPTNVHNTQNAYLAFSAALREANLYKESLHGYYNIRSVLSPAMCGYTGQMKPQRIAYQIYRAYEDYKSPPKYASLSEAIKANKDMLII
jgi:O-acetyl-ADP-ribose deacetylase (regulator of RNase III)